MKNIELTQNKYVLVDDCNYEWLNQWKWCAHKIGNTCYAETRMGKEQVSMHRLVMNLTKGDGKIVDHVNRNGLDNRKNNLRICSCSQNAANKKKVAGSSKYKGVWLYKDKRRKKISKCWQAAIRINGRRKYLGLFKKEIDAAKAYDKAAKKYFKEYAKCNFV